MESFITSCSELTKLGCF